MGRVYRAEQKALGRTVAVKVIHPHLHGEEGAAARFITEARRSVSILNRLRHVDYEAAWAVIKNVLAACFDDFNRRKPETQWTAFQDFARDGGEALDRHAIFEATHGTAPKYANQDKVNPGSVVLSGEMMFRYMGWGEAADLIIKGMEGAIAAKTVTYDFARMMPGAREMKCSEFGEAVVMQMR